MTRGTRLAAIRERIESKVRALHHYGNPPDVRLQGRVDGDVNDVLDDVDELLARLEECRGALADLDTVQARALLAALDAPEENPDGEVPGLVTTTGNPDTPVVIPREPSTVPNAPPEPSELALRRAEETIIDVALAQLPGPAAVACICGPSALRVTTLADCPIHGEAAPRVPSPREKGQ